MVVERKVKADISGTEFKAKKDTKSGKFVCRVRFSPYVDEKNAIAIYRSGETRKQAEERTKAKAWELISNATLPPDEINFDRFTAKYIADRLATRIRGSSGYSYYNLYKWYLSPIIGKMHVQELRTYAQVYDVRAGLKRRQGKEPLSVPVTNKVMSVLSMILDEAVRQNVTDQNPCKLLQGLSRERGKAKADKVNIAETMHRALSVREQETFFEAASKSWYVDLFRFMLLTGCRGGEACALKWTDVHEDYISIERTVSVNEKGKHTENPTKTAAGTRKIPISAELRAALDSQKERLANVGRYKPEGLVFPNVHNKQSYTTAINSSLHRIFERVNKDGEVLPEFTSHAFRATFCTTCANCGVQQETLMRWLGHSDFSMTNRYYREQLEHSQSEMERVSSYRRQMQAANVTEFPARKSG